MSVYYNDVDPFCCAVLRRQIALGNLPPGDVDERDIRTVPASDLTGYRQLHLFAGIGGIPLGLRWAGVPNDFSIITGGFPCQPHSLAGKRQASADERDLWGEFARLVGELKPQWVLAENVPGLLSSEGGRFFGRVLRNLAACGYDAEWDCIPAASVSAPHRRDRVFVVAYPNGIRPQARVLRRLLPPSPANQGWQGQLARSSGNAVSRWGWTSETVFHRVADGIPNRMERIRVLGNAVVPQVVEYVGRCILAAESEAA